MQVNGTKLDLKTAGFIATNLVGWGITIGMIITRLSTMETKLSSLATHDEVRSMVTEARVTHILDWHRAANAAERKK